VLVRLERNRTCLSDYGLGTICFRWLLDLVLRHGYSRARPIFLLGAWIIISAIYFGYAYDHRLIVPSSDNHIAYGYTATAPRESAPRDVKFDPVIYATDTLVPLVDLGQKKNFRFRKPSYFLVFNSFFGWMMTTFFAAGVSGLLRKNS
jgi:hypothetical protein